MFKRLLELFEELDYDVKYARPFRYLPDKYLEVLINDLNESVYPAAPLWVRHIHEEGLDQVEPCVVDYKGEPVLMLKYNRWIVLKANGEFCVYETPSRVHLHGVGSLTLHPQDCYFAWFSEVTYLAYTFGVNLPDEVAHEFLQKLPQVMDTSREVGSITKSDETSDPAVVEYVYPSTMVATTPAGTITFTYPENLEGMLLPFAELYIVCKAGILNCEEDE